MQKYEYATVAFGTATFLSGPKLDHQSFTNKLNEYGALGWELVQLVPLNRPVEGTFEIAAVFKRPFG